MELLPFTVRFAESEKDVQDVVALRIAVFGQREGLDNLVAGVRTADQFDIPERLLIARCKRQGILLGCLRYHQSSLGPTPAPSVVKQHVPEANAYGYIDRFAVLPGASGSLVSAMLMKALWVLTPDHPAMVLILSLNHLLRYYRALGFQVLAGAESGVLVPGLKPEPYWPMVLYPASFPSFLRLHRPHIAALMFDTFHPGINHSLPQATGQSG